MITSNVWNFTGKTLCLSIFPTCFIMKDRWQVVCFVSPRPRDISAVECQTLLLLREWATETDVCLFDCWLQCCFWFGRKNFLLLIFAYTKLQRKSTAVGLLLISTESFFFFDGEKMSNKQSFFADYDNDEISLPVDSIYFCLDIELDSSQFSLASLSRTQSINRLSHNKMKIHSRFIDRLSLIIYELINLIGKSSISIVIMSALQPKSGRRTNEHTVTKFAAAQHWYGQRFSLKWSLCLARFFGHCSNRNLT